MPVDAPNQGVLANEFMYHNIRSAQELYALVRAWMMLPLVLQAGLARKIVMDLPSWTQIPIPLLRYLAGIFSLAGDYSGGRVAFLAGTLYPQGTPWYFPAAFVLKTPLGLLGLLTLTAGLRLFRRSAPEAVRTQPAGSRWFVVLPLLVFAAMLLISKMNLGYRHLLPLVPFLYVWIGQLARLVSRRAVAAAVGLLFVLLVAENLAVYPHYRAYFTPVVGGPAQGYRYLVDSNLDWGQDLPGLADFQREHQIEKLYLGYFGSADPAAYGVRSVCLPGAEVGLCENGMLPAQGWVAVSATCLQGYCTPFNRDFYAPLRARTPAAMIGYSILVYHLP